VAQCVWTHLRESLNDFPREPRNSIESETCRDSPPLVFRQPLDLAFLSPQVTRILDRRFNARDVDRGGRAVAFETGNLSFSKEPAQSHRWLAQQLSGRHAVPRSRTDLCLVERQDVPLVPGLTRPELFPPFIVDEAGGPAPRRQAQIGVVDSEQQEWPPLLCTGASGS